MKKITLYLLTILIVFVMTNCSEKRVEFDDDLSSNNSKQEIYSTEAICILENDIMKNNISYPDFIAKFPAQCTRNTFQGYYSVLKQNNKTVFVFIDEDFNLKTLFTFERFKSRSEYDFINSNKTTKSEILAFDSNATVFPVSSVEVTGHIMKEGLLIIRYNRILDNALLKDPVVDTIQFFSNEDIESSLENFWVANTPYILSVDKNN